MSLATKLAVFFLCCLICDLMLTVSGYKVIYSYKRYPYRKKQRNERYIKRVKSQCENPCQGLGGLELVECERNCMSSQCYQELYGHDKLEEGEIDVRYNSFKGCIIQNNPP